MGIKKLDENQFYWNKLTELRNRYEQDLIEILNIVKKSNRPNNFCDKDVEKKIIIIHKLLFHTPETQKFECHIEILHAVEKQINVWRSLFMSNQTI